MKAYAIRHIPTGRMIQHDDGHQPRHINLDSGELPLLHEDMDRVEMSWSWLYRPNKGNQFGHLKGHKAEYEIIKFELIETGTTEVPIYPYE